MGDPIETPTFKSLILLMFFSTKRPFAMSDATPVQIDIANRANTAFCRKPLVSLSFPDFPPDPAALGISLVQIDIANSERNTLTSQH
jgi:hypothetical protein